MMGKGHLVQSSSKYFSMLLCLSLGPLIKKKPNLRDREESTISILLNAGHFARKNQE